ncbi:MAG TPA: DUF3341 domain-containing protein [Chthoniobacterales bacterium]|jgi:hypothetical protein
MSAIVERRKIYGLGARFSSAAEIYEAAKKVRDKGFRRWDVHTPYPVHGMDAAMGLKHSILGKLVFCGGLTGFITAICLEFIPSSFIYPLIVHGKPYDIFTVPAFFPIMFELTILFSAFTAVGGMFLLNGLPRWHHPVFNWDGFGRFSDDGFMMIIEAADPKFTEVGTSEFLTELGAKDITLIHE